MSSYKCYFCISFMITTDTLQMSVSNNAGTHSGETIAANEDIVPCPRTKDIGPSRRLNSKPLV